MLLDLRDNKVNVAWLFGKHLVHTLVDWEILG